jgi:hypothetical protein
MNKLLKILISVIIISITIYFYLESKNVLFILFLGPIIYLLSLLSKKIKR